jgi:NAD(P)-dependent dehydrogenase (short-subunit alcohol dehydrogenase family)
MDDVLSYYNGRPVVITGCSSGIGLATARMLSGAGAQVTGLDKNPPVEGVHEFIEVDMGDLESVTAAAARIQGPVEGLFNCAGVSSGAGDSQLILRINFLGMRAFLEALLDQIPAGGAIVTTASLAGRAWRENADTVIGLVRTNGFSGGKAWAETNDAFVQSHGGYATSKEAVILYAREHCLEFGRRGVRINVVAPGITDTPMLLEVAKARGPEFLDIVPEPFGRRATPEEQANLHVFLNSGWASYVNGQTIWSDGGVFANGEIPA